MSKINYIGQNTEFCSDFRFPRISSKYFHFQVQSEDDGKVVEDEQKVAKVDWVFKVMIPEEKQKSENTSKKPMSLLLPKPKLSGSREWLTNLFSPNKTRSESENTERSVSIEDKEKDEQIAIEINGVIAEDEDFEESQVIEMRKSPSEPISNMCSSMRRQIISRYFTTVGIVFRIRISLNF